MIVLTVLFLVSKIKRWKLFFKSASLQFSHVWKICILKKQVAEVILVGWFSKCQSTKKVGDRRLVKLSFRFALPAGMLFTKRNENRAWSQVNHVLSCRLKKTLDQGRGYTRTQGTQVLHHQINKIKKKDDYEENKER